MKVSIFLLSAVFITSSTAFVPVFTTQVKSGLQSTLNRDDFGSFADSLDEKTPSWQDELDDLLDPTTDMAKRQILLSDLLNKNQDIREAVQKAIQEGKIDGVLTPRGKRLREGSRAVARQVTNDILPILAKQATRPQRPTTPTREEFSKVTNRVFSALTNQFQSNLKTLQGDLADPRRIPERFTQQTESLIKEATNIFAETPIGLNEPKYTVVSSTDDYEIRDYASYKVVSTNMAPAGEIYNMDNLSQSGAAFNTLASYLFGANQASKSMDMTTPVTTTMSGEMRFYLADDIIPEPLAQDEGTSVYETGNILIQQIPAARLAVRRFAGFATSGEVARQKQALLGALEMDGVELDVPHGQTVGHVVFQYNPPYTLPVLRRNELAVPVYNELLQQEWSDDEEGDEGAWMDAPSD